MSFSSSEVFDFDRRRFGADTMSIRTFIPVLAGLVAGGLALAAFVASLTYEMQPNGWWFIGYFAVALPGVWLSANSSEWPVSSVGYLMVIAATGAIIGPYVHLYTVESVVQVATITMGATLALGFAGAVYPKSVESWGGFLFMALLILIFGDLSHIFMLSFGFQPTTLTVWDWVGALIFSAYIFYDMNRAVRMNYTLDNAVDCAVALYLDIINLFIRLLSIMGKRSD